MKKYNEFLNELNASTYLSASKKSEPYAPKLSKRFKEHGEKIAITEFLDKLYITNIEQWLTCAPKEDILAKRDKNTIHPVLLEIEEGGYLMGDSIFWNGAGMNKKSLILYDNDEEFLWFESDGDIYAIEFYGGYISKINPDENFENININVVMNYFGTSNSTDTFCIKKLPKRLAKQFFNSSFYIQDEDDNWRNYWNEDEDDKKNKNIENEKI